jgi:hypothetical protein
MQANGIIDQNSSRKDQPVWECRISHPERGRDGNPPGDPTVFLVHASSWEKYGRDQGSFRADDRINPTLNSRGRD